MSADARTGPAVTTRPLDAGAAARPPAGGPGPVAGFAAVLAGQLSRARVARASLLFVATLQSVGILVLLRGVVDTSRHVTGSAVVAGCSVLVVAFVALNLLAQRMGALRAARALDYYAALPVAPAAVVLATAASYAAFTVPGTVFTAVLGAAMYGLPLAHLWVVLPVVVAAGASLSGLGAWLGLALPRPELATMAGQLGMTAVLFLGVVPAGRIPGGVRWVRDLLPSTYAVDALAGSFGAHPHWTGVAWRLAVCLAVAVATLALATRAFRRAVAR